MDVLSNVLGLRLEEALRILKEYGWTIKVEYTGVDKCKHPGEARVARIKCTSSKKGVVTAVYQDTGGGRCIFWYLR